MAKKKALMFPTLRQNVSNAISNKIASTWLNEKDSDSGFTNKDTTHIMGTFKSDESGCSK